MTRFLLLSDSCGVFDVGRFFWREDRSVVYNCCWPSPAQIFSSPDHVGLVIIIYCVRFETSLFVAGLRWRYSTPPPHGSELITEWVWVILRLTVRRLVSLSWHKAPIWGLRPNLYYCQTIAALLMWGALSDERMGLYFTMYNVQCVYILHVILRYSFTNLI
jgi:hypothetical protein